MPKDVVVGVPVVVRLVSISVSICFYGRRAEGFPSDFLDIGLFRAGMVMAVNICAFRNLRLRIVWDVSIYYNYIGIIRKYLYVIWHEMCLIRPLIENFSNKKDCLYFHIYYLLYRNENPSSSLRR